MSEDDYVSVQRPVKTMLLADRNEIIEKCARRLELACKEATSDAKDALEYGAAVIRALKEDK